VDYRFAFNSPVLFRKSGLLPQLFANLIGQFFSLRFPEIEIGAICIQILSYPAGKLFEKILPTRKFHVFGMSFTLNPGPFNQKEHMLITIMGNVAVAYKYATGIFVIQILPLFFDQQWARNKLYQICIFVSMQCFGYGLAGLGRTCIVFPDYCIYPQALATVIINRSLHEKRSGTSFEAFGITVTRYRYLLLLGCAYFIWHIIGPGYMFQALSNFNWPTWIDPKSKILAFIFGGNIGLGLNPFPTFDWNRSLLDVRSPFLETPKPNVQPIILPYFTVVNFAAGMLITAFCFMLPLFFKNVWYSGYIPFNRNGIFDRFGKRYDIRKVVDARGNLDLEKYRAYSVFL
jgi:OPT family oligopeptide transporter